MTVLIRAVLLAMAALAVDLEWASGYAAGAPRSTGRRSLLRGVRLPHFQPLYP